MGYAFDPGLDPDCLSGVLLRICLSESEFEPKLFTAGWPRIAISYFHAHVHSTGTDLDGQPDIVCDSNEYVAAHVYAFADEHTLLACPSHQNTSPNQYAQGALHGLGQQCGKHIDPS